MNYYYFLLLIPLTLLLFGFTYLLRKISQPAINYVRIIIGVASIIFLWAFGSFLKVGPGLLVSGMFLVFVVIDVFALTKYYSGKKSMQK